MTDSPLALPVVDAELELRLINRLARIEELLATHCQARTPYVTQAATHLMMAGGKRFRPLLVLLAAELGPRPEADEVLTAACVVELTHVASLYHDDVMDESGSRPAPSRAWSRVRSWRPSSPGPMRTRSPTTSRSWPARPVR